MDDWKVWKCFSSHAVVNYLQALFNVTTIAPLSPATAFRKFNRTWGASNVQRLYNKHRAGGWASLVKWHADERGDDEPPLDAKTC
jgi:hypothetical protein